MTATATRRTVDYNPRLKLRRCRYCGRSAYEVDGWYSDDICIHCESKHLLAKLDSVSEDLSELERIEAFGGHLDHYQKTKLEDLEIEQKQLVQRIDEITGVSYAN